MSEYVIRQMTKEDAGKVAELEAANFSMPWKEADFAKAAEEADVVYLLAEEGEQIIGCCGLRNLCGEGEITNVSVAAGCRGRHIAENLMKKLLEEGRRMGAEAFTLEVRSGNLAAVSLYEKLGFVTEGVRPGFYQNPREDARIMWKRENDSNYHSR